MFNKIIYTLFIMILIFGTFMLELFFGGKDIKGAGFWTQLSFINILSLYLLPIMIFTFYLFFSRRGMSDFLIAIIANFLCLLSHYLAYHIRTNFNEWNIKNIISDSVLLYFIKYNGFVALIFGVTYFVVWQKNKK